MNSFARRYARVLSRASAHVFWIALASTAEASFTYTETFADFGAQQNFACAANPAQYACGAAEAINAFIYLEHKYPSLYGNLLTPNYAAATNADATDSYNFAFNGWQTGTGPIRQGYYSRPPTVAEDWMSNYTATLSDWITDYAPGTTILDSWYRTSPYHDRLPGILDLADELMHQVAIELFISGTDFYHVVGLTGISCSGANCSIDYQDPNSPATLQHADLVNVGGGIGFVGVPGSGYNNLQVAIVAAFSESPVPEPASSMLVLIALAALAACIRWSRRLSP